MLLPTEDDYRAMTRPFLGVRTEDGDDGVLITRVADESPAAEAGILADDLLRSFAGRELSTRSDLGEVLYSLESGGTAEAVVERAGERITLEVALRPR